MTKLWFNICTFFSFHSFPHFRCWCHHICRHLLIWHVCFGGETHIMWYNDLSLLLEQYVDMCVGVCRWRCWKSKGMESLLMFLRRPSTMPYSYWRTHYRGWDEKSGVYVYMFMSILKDLVKLCVWFWKSHLCICVFPEVCNHMFVFVGVNPEMPRLWSQYKAYSPRAAI